MASGRCPYDGSVMREDFPEYDFVLKLACFCCPHVEYFVREGYESEEDQLSLYDLGCSCGPCKEKGKRRGLRYQ